MLDELERPLQSLRERGLMRQRRMLESPQGPRVSVDGAVYLSFCSNDYLGLATAPELVEAVVRGARSHGVGAGASHLLSGHSHAHHELELELASFVGLPRALLFSTGYMANMGVVSALVDRSDTVFADKLNHASLNDAALLSRARLRRYAHGDLAMLEQMLGQSGAGRKLVISDAVFSMDGDIAPVPELLAICERHDAWLLLDDAHGFGVLGDNGRGVLEYFGLAVPRIIYMATLGKAAGVFGAFVAGEDRLVETLIQNARTYVYTTATPPLLAVALSASLKLIDAAQQRRAALKRLIGIFRARANFRRWKLLPSETAIQPLVIGPNNEAMAVSEGLAKQGILVPAIRPPTVPEGKARLRISLSAAHLEADIVQLVEVLLEIENKA
ncbi:MAG: 8-amino-7-oxononanoate synthase [Burkholderiales bacterium]